jgi:hypothetical protein
MLLLVNPLSTAAHATTNTGFRFALGGIGPTSNQSNASREMQWVLSRPWAVYLAATVSGDATVEQLQELRRLGWAQPQLDEVTSTTRRARRAKHKHEAQPNLTAAHAAWLAAGWTDDELLWQLFCEDDSAGTGWANDLLVLARKAGFTDGRARLTGEQAAAAVADYVREATGVLSAWPRVRRQARVGYPGSAHAVAPWVDAVLVERTNDDVGSLMPALAYARGAARQYNLSGGWGVDLSLWWGVIDGCVSDLPASLFRRAMHLSYAAGARTIALEECGWFFPNGSLLPIGQEADAFGTFVQSQLPPAARGDNPDLVLALVVPRDHVWMERPSWDDTHGGRARWAFAEVAAAPQTAAIDGLMGHAFPGVGTFGSLAFPFGRFANNSDPPPSPFARSAITPEYSPDAQDAFSATSDLPLGTFANRRDAAAWFRPGDSHSRSLPGRDPSPMRPMDDTRWGGVVDVLVDDGSAPGGWPRVLAPFGVVVWASPLTVDALAAAGAFVAGGGALVVPAGAASTPELSASLSSLGGLRLTSELHAVRAYEWLEGADRAPVVAEPMLAVGASVAAGAAVDVLAASAPDGRPLIARRQLGRGAMYTVALPWFKGRHGDLAGIVQQLLDRLMRAAQPVAIESGLPTLAFTSSAVRGASRTVALANNAPTGWNGTLRIAPPPGCVARPRCVELPRGSACDIARHDARRADHAVRAAVSVAAYDAKTLRVTCSGHA